MCVCVCPEYMCRVFVCVCVCTCEFVLVYVRMRVWNIRHVVCPLSTVDRVCVGVLAHAVLVLGLWLLCATSPVLLYYLFSQWYGMLGTQLQRSRGRWGGVTLWGGGRWRRGHSCRITIGYFKAIETSY